MKYLERKQLDREALNRDLLVDLARENDLRITNTWFKKPDNKLFTFRIPGTTDLKEINASKFATTDHILCRNSQKHMIKDVESNTSYAFPSDHFPVVCTLKMLVFRNKRRPEGKKNTLHPTRRR